MLYYIYWYYIIYIGLLYFIYWQLINRFFDFKVFEINVDVCGIEKFGFVFVNSYLDLMSFFCCILKFKFNICYCYDMQNIDILIF